MSSNQVHRLEDVNVLHACVPQLADLSFLRCPITEAKGYVPTVLAKLPGLTMLDGNPVSAVDRVPVTSGTTALSVGLVKSCALTSSGARVWPRVSTALLGDVEGGEPPEDPKWLEVDNIDLSHRLLKRLSNLSYASQLRKACFNDNEVWCVVFLFANRADETLFPADRQN